MDPAYVRIAPLLDYGQRLRLAIALQKQAIGRAFRDKQAAHVQKDAAPEGLVTHTPSQ